MRISLESDGYLNAENTLSMEGISALKQTENEEGPFLYILLTDTGTTFSKVAKVITGDPYNHVSLMLDKNFDEVYTFSLKSTMAGENGGFQKEDRKDLNGSKYSLYRVAVSQVAYDRVKRRIIEISLNAKNTRYHHLGLINAILSTPIFSDTNKQEFICSQFVASMLVEAGVNMFTDTAFSTLRPYDFVRKKLLKFVERGTIRA